MTNKEAIEILEERIKTSESLGEHIEPNIYDNNGYGDFVYKHYQANILALEALKNVEFTRIKNICATPGCFISNENLYPLCKGADTPQGMAENECITCALFEDYDNSIGY